MKNLYVVNYANGCIGNFVFDKYLKNNINVIVENEKGEQFGTVIKKVEKNFDENKFHRIIRMASTIDYNKYKKNLSDENNIILFAKKLAKELNLKMNVINSVYSFDRSQLLINFYADERVDFREYAKKLAQKYKTRIELRQIGARDRSKEVSGIGPCGQKFCCARFLNNLDSVSINMAKNQNLALNPAKINGSCNRLMCCLAYEDDIYSGNRSKLPQIGSKIKYNGKDEVVRSLKVLENKVIIFVDKERIEISAEECN